jgi:hypothetical protein
MGGFGLVRVAAFAAATVACVAACGGGGDDDGGNAIDAGDDDDDIDAGDGDAGPVSSCLTPALACPGSAKTIGVAGGYGVDAFPLTWSYCAAEDVSVAPPVYFNVPDDILSFSLTVDGGFAQTAVLQMQLDGQDLLSLQTLNQPPFRHGAHPASSLVLPISPNTFPQGPFCVAIVAVALGDHGGEPARLSVTSRRDDGGAGQFDLNVIQALGADIDPADVDAAIALAAQVYLNGDAAQLKSVDHYTIEGFDRVSSSGQDLSLLRAAQVGTDPRRLNLFIVEDFLDASLFGLAGGVPGPNGVAETAASGVVVGVAAHRLAGGAIDVEELAATIGHELGHQLGLFHTSESDGKAHDNFSDTPECTAARDVDHDGVVTPDECVGFSDQNLMFWTSGGLPQQEVSTQQSQILFFSPAMR